MQQSFDPYAPPQADLIRVGSLERTQDWVYPLVLHSTPSWIVKLHVELRDALQRTILSATHRPQIWELFSFRVKRDPTQDLPAVQAAPRRFYSPSLTLRDGGEELATVTGGLPLARWTAQAPGGIWVQVRPTNPVIRWRGRARSSGLPAMAAVGQQLPGLGSRGYPIMTVHAGPTQVPFLVVRRSFEGVVQSTRVERLEGEVKPETEWLALQLLVGAFLHRLPGIG